jgi:hypothetical protein
LFETWVVSEVFKQRLNAGLPTDLYFWRDSTGNEVDLIAQTAQGLMPIEIKSGSTFASDWAHGLAKWQQLAQHECLQPKLIYGGSQSYQREGLDVIAWQDAGQLLV